MQNPNLAYLKFSVKSGNLAGAQETQMLLANQFPSVPIILVFNNQEYTLKMEVLPAGPKLSA